MRAKNVSRRSGPGGGNTCVAGRAKSACTWSCARRAVAVEATIFGLIVRLSASRAASASIAVS